MTFDNQVIGFFSDVRKLYDAEKENLLKTSLLTNATVRPSKLQLRNVQHVLKVFNNKVEAALRLQKCGDTADIIQLVLNWWNVVNVSSKHQQARLNDPHRHVQDLTSTNLSDYHQIFQRALFGHGKGREHCVTHDTKKALVQTMQGMAFICAHLLTQAGFQYVLLRELQSDRIEGEFSVYSRGVQILDFFKKFMFSKLIWCTGPKKQLLCKKNSKILSLSYRSWRLKKSSIIAPRGIPL